MAITGVEKVEQLNKAEFIIQYNPLTTPSFDIELLQALQQRNISYRQLTKGLSLEQQLFA